MRRSLIAALFLAACGPTAPAPTEVAKSAPAEAAKAPTPSPAAAPASSATPASEATPAPAEKLAIPKEPPLTPEEIALIESDSKSLTPEQRRARAHALRRKILQNPDSPQAQQLEKLRRDVEAGVVTPELPGKPGDSGDKGLILHAPGPKNPAPAPAPAPAP